MASSLPWIDTAQKFIENSRNTGEPVWIHSAVEAIRREHPDCGLTEAELADIVRQATIEQRWSLGG